MGRFSSPDFFIILWIIFLNYIANLTLVFYMSGIF
jgi:hypothetical protein